MKTLTLVYFPVRARTESAKMMLEYAKIPYSEIGYKEYFQTTKSWPELKNSGEIPTRQLPLLDFGGDQKRLISQSGSINRYVAKIAGLIPEDDAEAALVDSVYEMSQDMAGINPIVNIFRGETFEQKKSDYFKSFESKLDDLETLLGSGPYFCSRDQPSYSDFGVWHILDNVQSVKPGAISGKATLLEWMKRISSLDGVSDYLNKRPDAIGIGTAPNLKNKD